MSETVVLNQNSDFKRLYKRGASYTDPALVIYLKKNSAGICRIGITSSKKIGNAVARNKSRRLIRAAFQEIEKKYGEMLQGYDLIFVCRVRTRFKKSTDLEKVMEDLLSQAGVIKK